MFEVRSQDVSGFSKAESMLAEEVLNGVEATLNRVRSAASTPGYTSVALGQLLEFASADDKAAEAYSRAFDHEDRDVAVEALARYVITQLKQKNRTEALKAAERLAALDPEYTVTSVISGETYSSMTLLGEALVLNERLEDAESAYNAALKTLPDDPFVSGRLLLFSATAKSKDAAGLMEAATRSSRYADLANTLKLMKSGVLVGSADPRTAVAVVSNNAVGRPFRVEEARIASVVERDDWA